MDHIVIHGLRLFLFILQVVHCFKHDNALYPQWLYQVLCLNALPLVSYAFQVEVVSEDEQFPK